MILKIAENEVARPSTLLSNEGTSTQSPREHWSSKNSAESFSLRSDSSAPFTCFFAGKYFFNIHTHLRRADTEFALYKKKILKSYFLEDYRKLGLVTQQAQTCTVQLLLKDHPFRGFQTVRKKCLNPKNDLAALDYTRLGFLGDLQDRIQDLEPAIQVEIDGDEEENRQLDEQEGQKSSLVGESAQTELPDLIRLVIQPEIL